MNWATEKLFFVGNYTARGFKLRFYSTYYAD